jgi:aryl-alcohol dehydrogenase-like predicted oxidoreductase
MGPAPLEDDAMYKRPRPPGQRKDSEATRRQFLSTVVVGALSTACGDHGMPGMPGMPGTGPTPPGRDPRPRGSGGNSGSGSPGSGGSVAQGQGGSGSGSSGQGGASPAQDARAAADIASAPTGGGRRLASDQVILGATGIKVSRLAMGSGTHGSGGTSEQTRLGIPGFSRLLLQSYHEQGLNFWETADGYGAHPHLKEAIRQVGRDKVVIMTKSKARTAAQMQADLDRFRTELGIEQIDIVLLHAVTDSRWTTNLAGAMEALSAAKQKGIVRAHGISCHSLGALRLAAATPWVDVDLARINPARIEMDADPATVIEVLRSMKAAGKGVIGMKILGVGGLARTMDTAINHAMALDVIDGFTIGFTSYAQLTQVTGKIAAAPAPV